MTPTRADLVAAIQSVGITCFYGQSRAVPVSDMPTLSYRFVMDAAEAADDGAWGRRERYNVELCEGVKDFELEDRVCAALDARGIAFDRFEYEQDGWLQTVFEVEVLSSD